MNWLQRLLGIDKILLTIERMNKRPQDPAPSLHQTSSSDEIERLKRQLQEYRAKESLMTEQAAKAATNEEADRLIIERLKKDIERLKATNDPEKALQAYFSSKLGNSATPEDKHRGRPSVNGRRKEILLDLDLWIIMKEIHDHEHVSVARLINSYVRAGLEKEYPELMNALMKGLDD